MVGNDILPAEVLLMVFDFLDKTSQRGCTCVCKFWREPALDIFWKELDSFEPLLRLLGTMKLIPNTSPVIKGPRMYLHLDGTRTSDDWKLFDDRAKRVRVMRYSDVIRTVRDESWAKLSLVERDLTWHMRGGNIGIGSAVVHMLTSRVMEDVLVPKLRKLTWNCTFPGDYLAFPIFLNSDLKDITICLTRKTKSMPELLEFIKTGVKGLQALRFRGLDATFEASHLSSVLKELRVLQTLEVTSFLCEDEILKAVTTHPGITNLSVYDVDARGLDAEDSSSIADQDERGSLGLFNNLTSLHLRIADKSLVFRVLHCIPYSSPLRSLVVTLVEENAEKAIKIISQSCPLLQKLILNINSSQSSQLKLEYQVDNAVENLFDCPELEILEVTDTSRAVTLSCGTASMINTVKWKNLRCFQLNPSPLISSPILKSGIGVPYNVLRCLANGSTTLSHIGLHLQWNQDVDKSMEVITSPSPALRCLDVGSSSPPAEAHHITHLIGLSMRPLTIIGSGTDAQSAPADFTFFAHQHLAGQSDGELTGWASAVYTLAQMENQ